VTVDSAAARGWACQQHLLRFFQMLDANDYDAVVGLFEADATWQRPGASIQGHEAIRAALQERPANRVTRHVVTNMLVTQDDGPTVRVNCLLTTYAIDEPQSGVSPRLVDTLAGIFSADGSLRFDAGEPRISHLALAPHWTFERGR
jgi:3-phenylpropionate/cinnamic acid dioxygenase small subunit